MQLVCDWHTHAQNLFWDLVFLSEIEISLMSLGIDLL